MNYINTILEINKGIDLYYRTSKTPIFIKKIKVKRRRSKLKKNIEKIHNLNGFDGSLLKEYISLLYLIYPPYGVYKNCKKIEPIDTNGEKLSMLFEFPINEENKEFGVVALSPDSEKIDSYLIRYIWTKEGKTIFANSDENVSIFKNNKSYDHNSYPYSSKVENDIIKDYFVKFILDNIYDFTMEFLERSERILEHGAFIFK